MDKNGGGGASHQPLIYQCGLNAVKRWGRSQFWGLEGLGIGMAQFDDTAVDWTRYEQARASMGVKFFRYLGYLRDDGGKAVSAIEEAMRARDAVAMVNPADLLKTEAVQIGAMGVAELAEEIEMQARDCVEWHQSPDTLLEEVVKLRQVFDHTVAIFDQETNPLQVRRAAQARRPEMIARG